MSFLLCQWGPIMLRQRFRLWWTRFSAMALMFSWWCIWMICLFSAKPSKGICATRKQCFRDFGNMKYMFFLQSASLRKSPLSFLGSFWSWSARQVRKRGQGSLTWCMWKDRESGLLWSTLFTIAIILETYRIVPLYLNQLQIRQSVIFTKSSYTNLFCTLWITSRLSHTKMIVQMHFPLVWNYNRMFARVLTEMRNESL